MAALSGIRMKNPAHPGSFIKYEIVEPLGLSVTAAAQGTPAPAEMAQWGRTALLASRVNFLLSIPMLFFMGAGSHFK